MNKSLEQIASDNNLKLSVLRTIAQSENLNLESISAEYEQKIVSIAKSSYSHKLTPAKALELAKSGNLNIEMQSDNSESATLEPEEMDLLYAAIAQGKSEANAFLEVRKQAFVQQLNTNSALPLQEIRNQAIERTLVSKQFVQNAKQIVKPYITTNKLLTVEETKQKVKKTSWSELLEQPKSSVWDELL